MSAAIIHGSSEHAESREIWRQIPGESGYEASNLGRIRSWRHLRIRATGEPLLLKADYHHGYQRVMLHPGRRHAWVHRLVLTAFVGPCPAGYQCRHFPDRDKANNRLGNVSWATPQQNHDDMIVQETRPRGSRHGTHTRPDSVHRGSRSNLATLNESDIPVILDLLEQKTPMHKIGKRFGVTRHAISSIRDGKTWRHVTTR